MVMILLPRRGMRQPGGYHGDDGIRTLLFLRDELRSMREQADCARVGRVSRETEYSSSLALLEM
jgi:hypothetical protein